MTPASPRTFALPSVTSSKIIEAHPNQAVVVAGPRQPAEVHHLVHLINDRIGAVGRTVRYTDEPSATKHVASLTELHAALNDGRVDTLVIIGANPVYDAPADLDFAAALAKAPHTVHLGLYNDETGSTLHLARQSRPLP